MKNLIVMLLTIVLLAGCAKEKKPLVTCNYYVRYEEDGKKITAEAGLFKTEPGATIKPYSPDGGVAFVGSNMTHQQLPNGKQRYFYSTSIELPDVLRFSWNDDSGERTVIEFESKAITDFEYSDQGESYVLKILAPPIQADESVVVLYTDSQDNKKNLEFNGPFKENTISIQKNELEGLVKGEANLSLVLTKISKIQQPGCDCTGTYSHYSRSKEIRI